MEKKTYYCSKVTLDHWVAKNRLEAEAKKIALEAERRIIPGEKLSAFISEFNKRIDRANLTYHRCKALDVEENLHDYDGSGDVSLVISGVTHLTLYKLKMG